MNSLPSSERTWIDNAADRFEQQWASGAQKPLIEDFLAETDDCHRADLIEKLARVGWELRRAAGEQPRVQRKGGE
jgi:hypothetical protein